MLTTEELILLNNLIYLQETSVADPNGREHQVIDDCYEGKTVGEFLNSISVDSTRSNFNRAFISGQEWVDTVNAISANPKLMQMEIVTGQEDRAPGGGGGESVLIVDHVSKEAVFVFRGTADREWYDDFYAGGPTTAIDGVSTPQQEHALTWYNGIMSNQKDYGYLDDYYITVTGHSKGGNKAKYITLLEEDNPVDRCVSLDGQGFSDEFFAKYASQISARQGLIENHNVSVDFVNLLLNDVGEKFYYSPQNLSLDINYIPQFHSPNTFYSVSPNGNMYMQYAGHMPPQIMQEIDEMVNGLLRSMPVWARTDALEFIGQSVEIVWNGIWTNTGWNQLVGLMIQPKNIAVLMYVLEYAEADVWFSLLSGFFESVGIDVPEGLYNVLVDVCNALGITSIYANVNNGDDLIIKSTSNQDILPKNIKELIAAGAAAGVAAVATINAKNSEEEHLVHDNMYFGPRPEEEGAEQLISGAEQLAEIGVPDEEYEYKNDYGALSHGGGMYEHIGSAMDEAEEEYSGGYNSHGGTFYHDLEQEESGMGGAGSHGLSNGFQMGALAGLEVENNQDSAALFADNSHGFDEFAIGNGFSSAFINGTTVGANAHSKNGKTFLAVLNGMKNGREKLVDASGHMSAAAIKVNAISNITVGTTNTEKILGSIKAEINQENNECKELHVSFSKITDIYRENEESLTTKKYKNRKRLASSAKPPLHPGMLHRPELSELMSQGQNYPGVIHPVMPSPEDWHDNHEAFDHMVMTSPEEWHNNHEAFDHMVMPSPEDWHDNHEAFDHMEMPSHEEWHDNTPGLALVGQDGEVIISTQDLQNIPSQIGNIVGTEMAQVSEMFGVDSEPPLNPHPKNEPNMIRPEPHYMENPEQENQYVSHTPYEMHDNSDAFPNLPHEPIEPQHDASDFIKPELHAPHEPQHNASDFIKPELHTPDESQQPCIKAEHDSQIPESTMQPVPKREAGMSVAEPSFDPNTSLEPELGRRVTQPQSPKTESMRTMGVQGQTPGYSHAETQRGTMGVEKQTPGYEYTEPRTGTMGVQKQTTGYGHTETQRGPSKEMHYSTQSGMTAVSN